MSNNLPNGWTATPIEQVTSRAAQRQPQSEEEFVYIDISSINRETKKIVSPQNLVGNKAPSRARQVVKIGDVLVSMTRPNMNAVALVSKELDGQIASTGFDVLRPVETESRWLFYLVRSSEFVATMSDLVQGALYPAVRPRDIRGFEIPLAPFNEQKRIADKLDAVLARVDACRDSLDRIPAILKRFRQSVLNAATSGKLTEDWRSTNLDTETGLDVIALDAKSKAMMLKSDESLAKKKSSANSEVDESYTFELPESWAFTSWGKMSEWITYGFTRPMPSISEGMKLVTAKDVLNFVIRLNSAGYTTPEAFSALSDKDRPQRGDLLITKDGTIGRAAIVNSDEQFCINQSVAVCWLRSTSMNKRYLELVANAEFTQQFVFEKSKGMAIQHLSIIDFAQCPVPVPQLQEQTEIVRRVESLFAYADRLEARYTAARTQVEKLTPATLAKAFRGELVPQDPNDEPASVLLERIKEQHFDKPLRKPKKSRKVAA